MDKIYKDGYDFFFWYYENQTKIKHYVFQEYFDKWVKILGSANKLNYFDCYAGSGAYIEKEEIYYGSPILAAEIIEKNSISLGRDVTVVFIEQEKENIENIKKILKYKTIELKPIFIEGDFDKTINEILDDVQNNLKPTFFFIDPFGFKIKFLTLKRIMAIPKSEIFLNFMFNNINRFLTDEVEPTLNELFGCEEWKIFRDKNGIIRERGIVDLFKSQLKQISKYVFPYRMSFPNKNRTYYYLFHLTNKSLGCSIMKSSFAKFNYGKVEYRGPRHRVQTFSDIHEFKIGEVKEFLSKNYSSTQKTFNGIIEEIIDEVPYLEKTIRESIKEMEKEKSVQISRITSKTSRGVDGQDIINFI